MEATQIIKSLRLCSESIYNNGGRCDRERCYAFICKKHPAPMCCADMFAEAADLIESLDERVAIMSQMEGTKDDNDC